MFFKCVIFSSIILIILAKKLRIISSLYPCCELLDEQVQMSSEEESQGGTSLKATRLKEPPFLVERP